MITQSVRCKAPDGTYVRWQGRTGSGPGDAIGRDYVRSFVKDALPYMKKGYIVEYSDPEGCLAREVREEIEAQTNVEAANL